MNGKDGVLVLSWSLTFIDRFLFIPYALIAATALITGWMSGDPSLLLIAAVFTATAVLKYFRNRSLKEIWIDGDTVHASTFRRTITFPVAAIAGIEVRWFGNRAYMHLRQPTAFGFCLRFRPRGRTVRGSNPILDEALARARTAPTDQLVPLKIVSPWGSTR
jgi:hypothetical protein